MAGWSSLAFRNFRKVNLISSVIASSKNGLNAKHLNHVPVRYSGHSNEFIIRLSQYRFMKARDLAHFYFMLGAIPLTALILYCHIFIGPAELAKIPEGYVPKHWEYFEHPITRWLAKLLPSPQECYEKELHKIYIQGQLLHIRELEKKIENMMKERQDYQAWYFVESPARTYRKLKEINEELKAEEGKGFGTVL